MKIGENLHGFLVESKELLPEADGTLYMLRHGKLDTPLVFLDRDDSNKSFYIAFKTLPTDDTGVFHIIEHSVLCGSKKFPVKEPFVELLKSSLKTFLNAMTYPDKTVYPVSSRSDSDFLNLIDVYMDAVFHPLMLENERIFMQEGHRYELESEDSPLGINGVVYNEMKGAMSSPDEISYQELLTLLYPDSIYGRNSGGDPDAIKNLTYQQFCAEHKKHYHPSNAYIFLDGRVDLERVLPLIDSYLSEYEPRREKILIGDDPGCRAASKTVNYELAPEEPEDGKSRIYLGVRSHAFDETERALELSVLADAIAGSNESPLKKALLDRDVCEDVSLFPLGDGIKFCSYAAELKNIKNGNAESAFDALMSAFAEIAQKGIGKDRLEASINAKEFKLREKDFGSLPKGLVFGLAMLDTWLYGKSPALGLKYEDALKSVRAKLDTHYFEDLIREVFINNESAVRLTLLPKNTLGATRDAEEKKLLESIKSSMKTEELDELMKKNRAFEEWQRTPDSEENLNTLPTLSINDIPKKGDWTPTEVLSVDKKDVLIHNIGTGGISYVELLFDISDFSDEELSLASALASLLGKCRTEKYTTDELNQLKKSKLGAFAATTTVFVKNGNPTPYLYVTASVLDSQPDSLVEIVGEILNSSDFTDRRTVKNILTQKLIALREAFISAGHAAAVRRARAYVSAAGALAEQLLGFEMYKRLKAVEKSFDNSGSDFTDALAAIFKKAFTRARLTVAITGTPCEDFAKALVNLPKENGTAPTPRKITPFGHLNEGIIIPSRVSYISKSASLSEIGENFTGSMHVLSNILSYTHLWNSVRVKGGAYGAGFTIRQSGDASTYSYRDPSPHTSVIACDGSADFLRTLANEESDFEGYIIGTFGDYDSLNSARAAGAEATNIYMMGKTESDELQIRKDMLSFDKEELLRLADVVELLMQNGAVCIVGPEEQLNSCMNILKTKVEL